MAEIIGPTHVEVGLPATWMIDVPGAFGFSWSIQHGDIVNGQYSNVTTAEFNLPGHWQLRVDYTTPANTPDYAVIIVDTADDGKRN